MKSIFIIFVSANLMFGNLDVKAQTGAHKNLTKSDYSRLAETYFHKIWNYYRVPQYQLFSEYYPQKHRDSLTYMQGAANSREVSYLWPLSGIVTASNLMVRIPGLKEKYLPYVDSSMQAMEAYRDTVRKPIGYQAYPVRFEKVDRYYDDNGLVGIDYCEAYENTHNPIYLVRAKEAFVFILSGWSEDLGGGVSWLEGVRDQKPACSNGMATLVALKLYAATKDRYYLDWGKKFYDWMKCLRDSAGIYANDIKTKDSSVNKTYYTYNSGSMLEASMLLYGFTRKKEYLEEAKAIAEASYRHFGIKKGDRVSILDLPWFSAVLFRGYAALYKEDKDPKYINTYRKNLQYALENSIDDYGLFYNNWNAETDESKTPKWLLDEACMVELFARLAIIDDNYSSQEKKITGEPLVEKIKNDQYFHFVKEKALEVMKTGFNAGDGYREVWIRDYNTFIELAAAVYPKEVLKENLLVFFRMQGDDGNIIDGFTPAEKIGKGETDFSYSKLEPRYAGHKNTVETDQESSLVQAVYKYIQLTGDKSILNERIGNKTVLERLSWSMKFLMQHRYIEKYGLIIGATTADWGDVQPEHGWGVDLDNNTHPAIDIYDNAMLIVALNNLMEMAPSTKKKWNKVKNQIAKNSRKHLWNDKQQKFIPHIYLKGSPFPADFNENDIYYFGGTTVAIEAGLLNKQEIKASLEEMKKRVKQAGAASIGLTLYPPYPEGYFANKIMNPVYSYQNGGDWTWSGARMIQQLIKYGFLEDAYEQVLPMVKRVKDNNGFYEWYSIDNKPRGSGTFRGEAGVLYTAIKMFENIER